MIWWILRARRRRHLRSVDEIEADLLTMSLRLRMRVEELSEEVALARRLPPAP